MKHFLSKNIIQQFLKYSFVGIFNTIIGLGTILFLYNILNLSYIISNIIGYALGLISSFILNKRWTFASKNHYSKEILPFLSVFIISYIVNLLSVIVAVEVITVDPNIAQVIGTLTYTIINFLLNRRWTFSSAK